MTDAEIGKNAYNRRLENIRDELAVILEVNEALQEDVGPREKFQLLHQSTLAVVKISDDILAMERFGRMFKETGDLAPELLEKGNRV